MKYFVSFGGKELEVVLEERNGAYAVTVGGGRTVEVEARDGGGPDDLVVRIGERVMAASFEGEDEEVRIGIDGESRRLRIEDERERAAHAAEGGASAGPRLVRSPMPGFVVAVLVGEGDAVRADQTLLILEAMKMQNEIRAPFEGRVERLHVASGETVGSSEPLVTVVPAPG